MIKLKPGQTLNQYTKNDLSPYITNFVQHKEFIPPPVKEISLNSVKIR